MVCLCVFIDNAQCHIGRMKMSINVLWRNGAKNIRQGVVSRAFRETIRMTFGVCVCMCVCVCPGHIT